MGEQQAPHSKDASSLRAPQSLLQNRILLLLLRGNVVSASELARQIEGNRSSVSRAINALEKQGFVCRQGRNRTLTETGREEALRLCQKLPEQGKRAAEATLAAFSRHERVRQVLNLLPAEKLRHDFQKKAQMKGIPMAYENSYDIVGISSLSQIAASTKEFQRTHYAALAQIEAAASAAYSNTQWWRGESARYARIFRTQKSYAAQVADLVQAYRIPKFAIPTMENGHFAAIAANLERSQATLLAINMRSVTAFLDSQRLSTDALHGFNAGIISSAGLAASSWIEANVSLSRIVGDLSSIREQILHLPLSLSQTGGLLSSLRSVQRLAFRYDSYLREATEHVEMPNIAQSAVVSPVHAVWNVGLPAYAAERYVARVRQTIIPGDDTERALVAEVVIERREVWQGLDEMLEQVAPRLVPMWRGAWEALQSNGSDRIRQAAHSGREVLVQVLHVYAPDEVFTPEELAKAPNKRPTRKMRFYKIIGDASQTAPNLMEAMARNIDESYNRLSAVSHDHSDKLGGAEQEVVGLLEMVQGLLRYLLAIIFQNK